MIAALLFLCGLCLGSFLNVCIHRLPKGESVVRPRSRCPRCGHPIAAYDNIPLVSYLFLRGRCRHCGARISLLYPVVELLTGLALLLAYLRFGFSPQALKAAVLAASLLVLIFTDLRDRLLPDRVTYPGIAAGLLFALWLPVEDGLAELLLRSLLGNHSPALLLSLADGMLGALLGAGLLFLVGQVYFWLRRRAGMGLGDVKMMGMLGAFLGPRQVILVILFASVAGSLCAVPTFAVWFLQASTRSRLEKLRRRLSSETNKHISRLRLAAIKTGRTAVPFGVFLGAAGLIFLFWGRELVAAYLNLYR